MDKNYKKQDYKKVAKLLTLVSHLGYLMITPILLCIIGGAWLDGKLGTSPLLLIIGVVLGVCASFKNLFDYMNKFGK